MAITATPPAGAAIRALDDPVTISITGLTATTSYWVVVGQPGTMQAQPAGIYQFTPTNGVILLGTSNGAGNLTVTFVPPFAGTFNINVYTAPVLAAAVQTASFTAMDIN